MPEEATIATKISEIETMLNRSTWTPTGLKGTNPDGEAIEMTAVTVCLGNPSLKTFAKDTDNHYYLLGATNPNVPITNLSDKGYSMTQTCMLYNRGSREFVAVNLPQVWIPLEKAVELYVHTNS
jgi:hypothetical protein